MLARADSPVPARRVAWLLFAWLFCSYAYFFQGGGWNPNSRLALTRALVERGTLAIDAYRGATDDWSVRGGHFYTNKAPGLSFAAAPGCLAARALGPAADLDGEARLRLCGYLANLSANALPSALLGLLLFGALGRLGAGAPAARAWLVLAYGLGTLALPYATAFYAHQPAAALGFAAFAAWLAAGGRADGRPLALLAGAAAGAAVLFEMSCALVALALCLLPQRDASRRGLLPWYALGGLPAAAALALYQQLAFGSPFGAPFLYANPAVEVRVEGALFGWPTPGRIAALLVLPQRGLLYSSPLLALAPLGVGALRRADPGAARVALAVPLGFLLLVASFHAWQGGFAPGPRYLVPCLPFLFLPTALAMRRWPRLAAGLAALSVAAMLAIASVAVEIPSSVANPLFGFALPQLARGRVSVNPQGLDQLLPDPAYLVGEAPDGPSSFNLGELLWPHRAWSLAPLLALWLVLGLALARWTRAERGAAAGGARGS
jgi:hypothetical protein